MEVSLVEPSFAPASAAPSVLAGVAAILNAVAWPIVVGSFLFFNRIRIAVLLKVLVRKFSSAKKLKVGQFEIEAFEEELSEAVNNAKSKAEQVSPNTPVIPIEQVIAAKDLKLKSEGSQIPKETVLASVRKKIYDLAAHYDALRLSMKPSSERTKRMNEIAAAMRTLTFAGLPLRTELTRSESAGRRLAAICMLQVAPRQSYFRWLIERIRVENQAFVLYHTSLAILEFVRSRRYTDADSVRNEIEGSIKFVSSFSGGTPDQNTLNVLNLACTYVRDRES